MNESSKCAFINRVSYCSCNKAQFQLFMHDFYEPKSSIQFVRWEIMINYCFSFLFLEIVLSLILASESLLSESTHTQLIESLNTNLFRHCMIFQGFCPYRGIWYVCMFKWPSSIISKYPPHLPKSVNFFSQLTHSHMLPNERMLSWIASSQVNRRHIVLCHFSPP